MEAIIVSEQIKGIILSGTSTRTGAGTGASTSTSDNDSSSELSTVLSSRYLGLKEDWWKGKGAAKTLENISASKATVTIMRTQSKGKQVH